MKQKPKKNLERELGRLADAFPLAKGSLTATHSPCTRKSCKLCAEGKAVIIQDEARVSPEDRLVWAAQTAAAVTLAEDGKSAILEKDGKRLYAAILSEDLVLTVRDAAPTELSPEVKPAATESSTEAQGQRVNTGCSKLVVEATGKDAHTIAVAFMPLADGADAPEALPALKKLALW